MAGNILITGINGFVGEHVADAFNEAGFSVAGVAYNATPNANIAPKLDKYISCDLLVAEDVQTIDFADVRAIIHLAGLSAVGQSFEQPHRYIADNALMTYNLLAAAQASSFSGRIVVVSTGALYDSNQALPLKEDSPSLENSPYAIGKLGVEHVTNYFRLRGMDVVVVRPFNHIGPGQSEGFLVPDLYKQLVSARQGNSSSISVGNLTTRRDYTDVRDIAQAYKLIALQDSLRHSLYNICSGKSVSGYEILSSLQKAMGVENIQPQVDQSRVRPNDIANIYGDASLLQTDTGWIPQIDIATTIQDFVTAKDSVG